MSGEIMHFLTTGQYVLNKRTKVSNPFEMVEKLIRGLEVSTLDSLKEEINALKSRVDKIKAIEGATDDAIEAAQVDPKVGDRKFDPDGNLLKSCSSLSEEMQDLYSFAEKIRKIADEFWQDDAEVSALKTDIDIAVSFLKEYFEKVQLLTFLVRCHDSAVDEPIKTTDDPILAKYL